MLPGFGQSLSSSHRVRGFLWIMMYVRSVDPSQISCKIVACEYIRLGQRWGAMRGDCTRRLLKFSCFSAMVDGIAFDRKRNLKECLGILEKKRTTIDSRYLIAFNNYLLISIGIKWSAVQGSQERILSFLIREIFEPNVHAHCSSVHLK